MVQAVHLACRVSVVAMLMTGLLPTQPVYARGALSSYAIAALDEVGSTGASAVAVGVADYLFINDAGLGFGGTNTDVFEPGEATVLTFPTSLRNIPGQTDLEIRAFVGGTGATDNATVQVEASSDGVNYVVIDTFETQEARTRTELISENAFEGVKPFWIDFGPLDHVTHIRLTNLGGTLEGLRLDAVEGLHPFIDSPRAFEIRFERYREDTSERFLVRIKNISDVGGVPITRLHVGRAPEGEWMEDTDKALIGSAGGQFSCIQNCIGDADTIPGVPSMTTAWSLDGAHQAPPGRGLDPGRQAAHERFFNYDLDTPLRSYLAGFTFWIAFADGKTVQFDWDDDILGFDQIGALYQKYTYFSSSPVMSGPRPVHHYEFVDSGMVPVPALPLPGYLLLVALLGAALALGGYRLASRR